MTTPRASCVGGLDVACGGKGRGKDTKRRTIQVSRMVRWAGRMENQDMVVGEDVVVAVQALCLMIWCISVGQLVMGIGQVDFPRARTERAIGA